MNNYNKITYCSECLMPSSRPRITFKDNVCNSCSFRKKQKKIDWSQRSDELKKICDLHRSGNEKWDCIVPWSGGKDSSAIAHKLKFNYNMNPLLVTFSPLMENTIGRKNRIALQKLGFDNIFYVPNIETSRKLSSRFFKERGNPKIHWDAGVNALPLRVALEKNIKLIFYAEHGESFYGGKILHSESDKIRDYTEVIENQIGDDPHNWVDDEVKLQSLNSYIYPDNNELKNNKITAYYFSFFEPWDTYENFKYIKDKIDFKIEERTEGTFTNFDSLDDIIDPLYYYMQYIKFGFGRCIRDCARMIQQGHLSIEKAKEYIIKYDGELPEKNLNLYLEYLNINYGKFFEIIDSHRNEEIWLKKNNKWELRNKINYE
jgi:N-acetyl sugar amidotransferase